MTGEKVLAIGDASGMFSIDSKTKDYNIKMMATVDEKISGKNYPWKLKHIIPKVLVAGQKAGEVN